MEKNIALIGAFDLEGFDFNTMSRTAFTVATEKGFWDNPDKNVGEILMLIISELGEACEAHRKGRITNRESINLNLWTENMDKYKMAFEEHVKDTFEDEIADTLIRIGDYMGYRDWTVSLLIGRPEYDDVADEHFPDNVGEMLILCCARITTAYAVSISGETGDRDFKLSLETAVNEILLIARALNIDIVGHIESKMAYNKTRERLHGKKY